MKRFLVAAALVVGACASAQADDLPVGFGIVGLYISPDQTIDFLTAVDTVVWSTDVDNLYALDLDGFTFTSTDTDDQSDPLPIGQMMEAN